MTTDRKLTKLKFDDSKHLDWVQKNTSLVVIWIEPGGSANEGATGALVDIINACDSSGRHIPVWIGMSQRWPHGPKHAHRHERLSGWIGAGEQFDFSSKPEIALPPRA